MSAPFLSGMASFADNFAKSYGAENKRKSDEEERKAEREWRKEQQDQQRSEWKEKAELKTALKDAGAVRNVEQGTVVDARTGAGPMQRTFTQDPQEAMRIKATMDAEAEMMGAAPAIAQPGTAMTGNMAQGHQIGIGQAPGATDPNSSQEVAKRTAQAYRSNGQVEKALTMENAALDQQAKRLGLSIDEMKFADMKTNQALESALRSAPTWYEGAAKFATEAKGGGMDGIKVQAVLSPDSKTVTMRATMPNGKVEDAGTYPADESGMLQFTRKFASLPLEKRMNLMADHLKAEKDNSRWERTFDFNKKKEESDQQHKNRVLGHQEAQSKRAAETHAIAMEGAKVPAAVNDLSAMYKDQIKSASAAIYKAMAEGNFNPENAGTKALITEQAVAVEKHKQLLMPYIKSSGKESADPYKFDAKEPAPTTSPVAPQQTAPNQAAATPMQTIAPTMAPKPPTVLEALNPGGNQGLNSVMQPRAQAIMDLATQLKQEQSAMVQAAGGTPQAAIEQSQKVQSIRNAINQQLADMNPQQAALVLQAAGI